MRKKLQNKQHFAKNLFEGGLLRQASTTSGGTNNNLQHPKKETFDLEDRDDDDKIKSASTRGQRQKTHSQLDVVDIAQTSRLIRHL